MTNIPKETTLDNSVSVLLEGFPFIQNRCQRFQSDIFETRLMGEKVICLHGEEAASVFYDPEKFQRTGAIPKRIQATLMGKNAVQTMDNEPHRHRKAMFMSLMTPGSIHSIAELAARYWKAYIAKWEKMEQVVLFEEVQEIMCLAACAWTCVPIKPTEVRERAREFTAMVDAFGAVGPRHWRGRSARNSTERWIMKIIKQVREGKLQVEETSPLYVIAWHRGLNGELLDLHMAAVELINLLRPIVAIAWYVTFSAHALYMHPEYRQQLLTDEGEMAELFVQEVRRYYPFGPFLGARVRSEFEWRGHQFEKGTLVLLDMYGTMHDPKIWEDPNEFRLERFKNWSGSPFNFIPQGGGDHFTGHRCAGEWITIELMKLSLQFLVKGMTYEVPEQDLDISLIRMPTFPKSKFIISNVKSTGTFNPATRVARCPFHH